MDYNYQIKTLTERYSAIMKNGKTPEWAVKKTDSNEYVSCTIPFVGKNYFSQKKKVLVYASAENLSKYDGYLDNDKVAINRHRCFFDTSVESTDFFPSVHMRPFDDGAMSTAVLYILTKYLEINDDVKPAEFYENIAFGNYGKFSISGKKNIDYASSKGDLAYSHDLIKADIDILKPDIIILPSAILKADENFIKTIRGNADLIPLYQINSGNINRIISKKYGTSKIDIDDLPLCVKHWYKNLCKNGIKGKTKDNYLYVFPYIDDVLEKKH